MTSSNIREPLLGDHDRLISNGFVAKKIDHGICRDGVYDKYEYKRKIPLIERIMRLIAGTLSCLVTCCCLPCCASDTFENFIIFPLKGEEQEIRLHKDENASKDLLEKDVAAMGFNPEKRDTIIEYLQKPGNQAGFREAFGHRYKTFYLPVSHRSALFFIPSGNLKNVSVFIVYSDSGRSFASQKLEECALKYCAGYKEGLPSSMNIRTQYIAEAEGIYRASVSIKDQNTSHILV